MLTDQQIRNADGAIGYFNRELSTSEYYLAQKGVWYGKGAERLGLTGEVTKEQFVALVKNQDPRTGERLTARMNDTRKTVQWTEAGPVEREISNRRIYVDFTFSVPKSVSVYLAATKDSQVERLVHEAMRETMDDMEVSIQTRVRRGGADYDRTTGNAIWANFVHRTTRPVNGRVDPHWHCHALLMNASHDDTEGRWKAAQLGSIIADKGRYQAAFHARVAEKLMKAGHRLRRTGQDFEMDIFTPVEVRVFCKRTKQIEEIERRQRKELESKTDAIVKAAGERGVLLDWNEQFESLRAKLGADYREEKRKAKLEGEALEADWRDQLAPGRWEQITPEASRSGQSQGFLEPEIAKQQAIHHAFEKHSVLRESKMIEEILKWGIGTVPVRIAEAFVREGTKFLRNLKDPSRVTTAEVYAEDQRIIAMVKEGKGTRHAIDSGKSWKIRSERVAGDAGQTNAVCHVLRSTDLLTAVQGKPGVGKTTMILEASAAIRALTGQSPVMLAPTASAVGRLKEAGMAEADTVANFKDKAVLRAVASGKVLWCDEASFLDNRDFDWLLGFARENNCRVMVSGDPKQHGAVQRGHPFKMLIDAGVLECARLQKIYRQKDAPELREIIEHWHAGEYKPALEKIDGLGIVRERETRGESLKQIVEDLMEEFKAGRKVITIAPVHRDGKELAEALRSRMKEEGMLGKEDRQITCLESCDLSEAQRGDASYYESGQIVEFNCQPTGGFRSGAQWEVSRKNGADVFVSRLGQEKRLSLELAANFTIYERKTMPVSMGEHLLVTKNDRKLNVRNGDLATVIAMDDHTLTLDNGLKMDTTKPVHVRQGYSVTSQTSQSHEQPKMFAFVPVSATSQINAVQMLVSLSRASYEARLYTDSKAVLFEAAIKPGQGGSAVELVDGGSSPPQEIDLQPGARKRAAAEHIQAVTEAARQAQQQRPVEQERGITI